MSQQSSNGLNFEAISKFLQKLEPLKQIIHQETSWVGMKNAVKNWFENFIRKTI